MYFLLNTRYFQSAVADSKWTTSACAGHCKPVAPRKAKNINGGNGENGGDVVGRTTWPAMKGESRLWSPQVDFKVLIAWRGLLGKKVDPKIPIFTIFFGLSPGCVLVGVTTTAGHNGPPNLKHTNFGPTPFCQYLKCVANHQLVWNNPPNLKAKGNIQLFPVFLLCCSPAGPPPNQTGRALTTSFCRYHPCLGALFGVSWWWWWWWWCLKIHLQPPFIQLTTTPSATALCVISSNLRGRNVWNIIIVSPSGFLKDQVEFLFVSPCLPSSSTSGKTCWFVKLQYQQAKPKVQLNTLKTEKLSQEKRENHWLSYDPTFSAKAHEKISRATPRSSGRSAASIKLHGWLG